MPKGRPERTIEQNVLQPRRLAIMRLLSASEPRSFMELKRKLDLTDGNVSVHVGKLCALGLVRATKRFEGKMPRTEFWLTQEGREIFASVEAIQS